MFKLNLLNSNRNYLLSIIIAVLTATLVLSIIITSGSSLSYSESISILGTNSHNMLATNQNQLQPQSAPPAVDLTEYEAAILHMINTIRAERGLAALTPHQSLVDISRTRSNDMISRNYFSHYTPEGKTVFNIFRECGITYRSAGENLAQSRPANIGTPDAFMHAWMNSPTHAANILRARYGIIGVGMIETSGRRVVTTVFRNS